MSAAFSVAGKDIRLVFELARADNPRLFDELAQFPQGRKRVNRLRVLAYDGLLVQQGLIRAGETGGTWKRGPEVDLGAAQLTNSLFEPVLKE